MRNTSNISFYCRASKQNKQGLSHLEVSITINGQRKFVNTPLMVRPEDFQRKRQPRELTDYMDTMRTKLNGYIQELAEKGIPLTTAALLECMRTGGVATYTVRRLIDDFLALQNKKVGVSVQPEVYDRYKRVLGLFGDYVGMDKEVTAITPAIIEEYYLDLKAKYEKATSAGYMTKIKTLCKYALDNGHIKVNPFLNTKIRKGRKDILFLTEEEIMRLKHYVFPVDRLNRIRDICVVQAATGLSFCDLYDLEPEDIHTDGTNYYICKQRHKTGTRYTAVILPFGLDILQRYNYKLPMVCNQRMNAYISEIRDIAGFEKHFTSHTLRHSYASLLLNKGVRIETVSAALGHKDIATTRHFYAEYKPETIVAEISSHF